MHSAVYTISYMFFGGREGVGRRGQRNFPKICQKFRQKFRQNFGKISWAQNLKKKHNTSLLHVLYQIDQNQDWLSFCFIQNRVDLKWLYYKKYILDCLQQVGCDNGGWIQQTDEKLSDDWTDNNWAWSKKINQTLHS